MILLGHYYKKYIVSLIGAIVLTLKQSPVLKRQNIGLQAKRYRYLQHDYLNNK